MDYLFTLFPVQTILPVHIVSCKQTTLPVHIVSCTDYLTCSHCFCTDYLCVGNASTGQCVEIKQD